MWAKTMLLAATASAAALLPALAAAQDNQIQEIIVTARKRQESILNVPVVETAIPQAQLDRRQAVDLKDVAKLSPGLSLAQATGALGTYVSLRGVGTSAINAGVDASVALNVDGLQITQGVAYGSALFDVGQVEVLKGPQALFYGKNSPGGVIALRTADPTDRFELIARYGHEFEAQENRSELIISGPVTDSLKLRLATLYDTQAGYFENAAIAAPGTGAVAAHNARTPNDRNYVIRGTALWSPTAQFDARLKVTVTDDHYVGNDAFQLVSCPDGPNPLPILGIPFIGGGEDCKRDRTLRVVDINPSNFAGATNGGVLFHDTKQKYGSLELNYHPRPDLTVTSTTGHYEMLFTSLTNGSSSTFAGPPFVSMLEPLSRRDFTQELRVNSDFAGPVNFTAGAYYQNGKLLNRVSLPANTAYSSLLRGATTIGHYEQFMQIHSTSAFAQVRWKVIPPLEVALGARWAHEKRDLTAKDLRSGTPVEFPTQEPTIESDNVSPELTITYRPTDNITAFGSLKKGYKSGSFTLTAPPTPIPTAATPISQLPNYAFGDEKVEGGEVGLKSRWLDRRLAIDVALYDYLYSGLQVGAIQPVTGGVPINATLNAGGARVYGVDFDASYLPPQVEGLTLRGAFNWNHARFKSLNNVPCWGGQTVAEGCDQILNPATGRFTAQNMAGQPLVRAPDWQATFGFDYEVPIGNEMTLVVSNANQYSSDFLTYLGLRSDFFQPHYLKTDLSLTLKGPKDRWEFALIGKNLGDKLTAANCSAAAVQGGSIFTTAPIFYNTGGTTHGALGTDELACFMDRGREVWLRLTLRPFN